MVFYEWKRKLAMSEEEAKEAIIKAEIRELKRQTNIMWLRVMAQGSKALADGNPEEAIRLFSLLKKKERDKPKET